MVLNENYPIALIICCFTLLFLPSYAQNSFGSAAQSPLQTQCLSFPEVSVNGISTNENDNGNGGDGPKGLKINVHLSNQNIDNVGTLTIFIISSNGECAIAKINPEPVELNGQEKQLTFEFDSGVIDVNENFNACVETSNNFDFKCVLGTNSPSKVPEEVFLDTPIENQNSFAN
jgi:hypothetical protein